MLKPRWKYVAFAFAVMAIFFIRSQSLMALPQSEQENKGDVSSEVNAGPSDSVSLESVFSGEVTPTVELLRPMQEHFQRLIKKVRPATVGIQTGGASGSGVIVSRDGYVLTAAHVISRPDVKATIILQDGTKLNALTLGMDHSIDSGMLRITDEGKWPYLDMGESESLKEGQWVMAIGHPGGFDEERAPPIRVGRLISLRDRENVLQSDCTLVGGDSGGPLVDMNGDVIGIHSRIGGRLNQNYHVPVDTFLFNWDDLANKVEKGGIRSRSIDVKIGFSFADESSLKIDSITKDGPAEKAGIKVGDIIYKIDGSRIRNQRVLRRYMRKMKPDQEIKIVVKRGEEELEFDVTVVAR